MYGAPPVCLQSLGTKGTLHNLPTLHNNEPVPQVLNQVVNLSCFFSFEDVLITEPYKHHTSKIFAILFSIIGGLIVNPILCLIIKYERDKHYRTLINQLLSVLIYNVIILPVLLQCLKLYHYSVGSMHWFFCFLDVFLKPIAIMLDFLLLDAMCIVQYMFIFHLKNPNGMQDDFWKRFLIIWVIAFAFLVNVTYYILPGSNPNFYYI